MVRPCVRDDKPRALASGNHPYTRTNHALTCLLHISSQHLVHLWVSDVEHLKGAIRVFKALAMIQIFMALKNDYFELFCEAATCN